jgi:hypothetical protein
MENETGRTHRLVGAHEGVDVGPAPPLRGGVHVLAEDVAAPDAVQRLVLRSGAHEHRNNKRERHRALTRSF